MASHYGIVPADLFLGCSPCSTGGENFVSRCPSYAHCQGQCCCSVAQRDMHSKATGVCCLRPCVIHSDGERSSWVQEGESVYVLFTSSIWLTLWWMCDPVSGITAKHSRVWSRRHFARWSWLAYVMSQGAVFLLDEVYFANDYVLELELARTVAFWAVLSPVLKWNNFAVIQVHFIDSWWSWNDLISMDKIYTFFLAHWPLLDIGMTVRMTLLDELGSLPQMTILPPENL